MNEYKIYGLKNLCSSEVLFHLSCDLEVINMKRKDICSGEKVGEKLRFLVGDIFKLSS